MSRHFDPTFSSTFTGIIPMKDRIKKSGVPLVAMIYSHAVLISQKPTSC